MIVRNEAKNLERCLRSIRDLVDEVVLVDTGSTDETVAIARRLGARVFDEPWRNDFSLHRNRSLDLCRGKWILVIDGDEVLADEGDLREVLRGPRGAEADCVMCRIETFTEHGIAEQFASVRVFLRCRGRYRYPVHNLLEGVHRPAPSSALIRASYVRALDQKAARALPVLLQLAAERPDDAHAPFYLCKTYRALGNAVETLRWAKRCEELVPDSPAHASHWVWHFHAAFSLEGPEAAAAVLRRAEERHSGLADLVHCRLILDLHRWRAAVARPGPFAFASQTSPALLGHLPEACRLLGIPFAFGQSAPDPAPRRVT
jgi:glycosyltransferase involved in cell wall biosynthesis